MGLRQLEPDRIPPDSSSIWRYPSPPAKVEYAECADTHRLSFPRSRVSDAHRRVLPLADVDAPRTAPQGYRSAPKRNRPLSDTHVALGRSETPGICLSNDRRQFRSRRSTSKPSWRGDPERLESASSVRPCRPGSAATESPGQFESLVGKDEIAHHGVMETLSSCSVELHVVPR